MNPSDRVQAIITKYTSALTLSPVAIEDDWAAWVAFHESHQGQPPATGARTCVECGAVMVECKGKFGTFWGCAEYPKCRYTENT